MGPGDQSELNAANQRLNQALSRLESGLKNTREKAGRAETLEAEALAAEAAAQSFSGGWSSSNCPTSGVCCVAGGHGLW